MALCLVVHGLDQRLQLVGVAGDLDLNGLGGFELGL
jgi:hypothetical protein